MKSRLVALALAAVMTLGSCMSASAKEVFTKGLIGATVVKNGSYVQSVDLIDVAIWEAANKNSITTLAQAVKAGATGATLTNGTAINNAYSVAFSQLTTDQQRTLLAMIETYGQAYILGNVDNAKTAPYATAWDYNTWVSRMQIAPYAERYIVALNYKTLYENLRKLADYAVAQGQISVSSAYANTTDYASAKEALNILDARVITAGPGNTLSGSVLKIGQFDVNTNTTAGEILAGTPAMITVGATQYVLYPTFGSMVNTTAVAPTDVISTTATYLAVPVTTTTSKNYTVRTAGTVANPVGTIVTVKAGQLASYNAPVDGTGYTPIQTLASYTNYATEAYKTDVDNALAIAKEMQKSFKTAETYYNGQINEGVAYLIQNVRPDLADVKAANIDKAYGFDLDPYDTLKWNINEKKTIAFTSPSINDNMKETQSCVVLHFNTTACKWESIDAKFVKYNGVLGIEGDFTSASPVIVVTLKDYVDNGAAAAATATDAKKSPHTGEEF